MGCGEMMKDDEMGNDQGRRGAKCDEGESMSSKEGGLSEAKEKGRIKRMDEGMRSEIGAYGEGQVPGGWAASLKRKAKTQGHLTVVVTTIVLP